MTRRATPAGFTLIESLIGLVILSIGLLGAAATLLGSLGSHADSLRRLAALNLLHDVGERIRTNAAARGAYDTSSAAAVAACESPTPCDASALAGADRVFFVTAARALFPAADTRAQILFEPATGPAAPDRYLLSLRFALRSQPGASDGVALVVYAGVPVAGA